MIFKAKKVALSAVLVLLLTSSAGCNEATVEVCGIGLDRGTLALAIGESETLNVVVLPENASSVPDIRWSSNNVAVANVDNNGRVTAKGNGKTRIVASTTDRKHSVSCEVTVFVPLKDISVEPTEISLYVGQSEKLLVRLDPSDASMQDVEWTTSNPDVAFVSESGEIKAVGKGRAAVAVASLDHAHSAECLVKVIGQTYSNPIVPKSLPDPTWIKVGDTFYLYSTEDTRNVPIMTSTDFVNWSQKGTVFTDSNRPNFINGGGIWAPDINEVCDKYVLYFSMGNPGVDYYYGIGAAYSSSPTGPWALVGTDGQLMTDRSLGSFGNCIDPDYVEYNGRKYLFYGSFHNINYIELASDGLSLMDDAYPVKVAGSIYEGAYIHKHGDYWYLFASRGTWGVGSTNTYCIVVGRSASPFGPYLNKTGQKMLDNYDEVVIQSGKEFVATGHNGEIFTDSIGADWIVYHAQKKNQTTSQRFLMLSRIVWEDGWPIAPGAPDESNVCAPVFE